MEYALPPRSIRVAPAGVAWAIDRLPVIIVGVVPAVITVVIPPPVIVVARVVVGCYVPWMVKPASTAISVIVIMALYTIVRPVEIIVTAPFIAHTRQAEIAAPVEISIDTWR